MLSAKAPGQNSIGTGGQYSIGANTQLLVCGNIWSASSYFSKFTATKQSFMNYRSWPKVIAEMGWGSVKSSKK
jgi:hypothetical protein